MSRILAEVAGKLLTLLGYDGTDFRNIHVDAAGDLQVDVATSALPTGAATEATLALVATEAKLELVRALLSSIDLEIDNVRIDLADLETELKLKADLTETQPVSAAVLPLPAGASTSANQLLLRAKFQDQAFTYKGQVYQKNSHVMTEDATYIQLGAAVPEGEVWVITGMLANDWQTQLDVLYLGFQKGAVQYWGGAAGPALAKVGAFLPSPMILVEDDQPAAYYYNALNNNALTMTVFGYKMTLAP